MDASLTITVVRPNENPQEQTEWFAPEALPPGVQPCEVEVHLKRTINVGNYSSVHVGVVVRMPGNPASVNVLVDSTRDFVKYKLDETVSKLGL